ncbi:MAG: Uma2 family endonuclease [Dehalococcoidia bacterium]
MPISEATYTLVALEQPSWLWELDRGNLRSRPGMSVEHNHVQGTLAYRLMLQLDRHAYQVRPNLGRLRTATRSYYVPDLYVLPSELARRKLREAPRQLEVYDEPMPLVAEVWSPDVCDYDVEVKLSAYRQRGDLEIWRIHPNERTLTAWRRQPDGSYSETLNERGAVRPVALPNVTIELERLFE